MKPIRRMILCCTLLCSAAQAATQNDIMLHRQAPGRAFGITSDTQYQDDAGILRGALTVDQFRLAARSSVCNVNAFAFFGGELVLLDPGPPATETLRLRFWSDVSGLPGTVLYETAFVNPSRSWTGSFVALSPFRKEYLYRLPLENCFLAEAGTDYWLEIAQIGDSDSRFRWESSNSVGGFAQQFPIDTPWRLSASSTQLAYELWTPEPASGLALTGAVVTAMSRRRVQLREVLGTQSC